jgi:hypothetical protein
VRIYMKKKERLRIHAACLEETKYSLERLKAHLLFEGEINVPGFLMEINELDRAVEGLMDEPLKERLQEVIGRLRQTATVGEPSTYSLARVVDVLEGMVKCINALAKIKEIEFYIDPGNASQETLQAVFEAINDLHLAAGGLGFEFVSDEYYIRAVEGASV